MMDATSTLDGYARLMRAMRGTHQSSGLSEISSQFQDEWSAVPGRFCIDSSGESGVARRNLVFGPATLATGCSPIVLVTTPPHPASNARMMLLSDSVGGADASRNGFSNRSPVNVTPSWLAMMVCPSGKRLLYSLNFRVRGLGGSGVRGFAGARVRGFAGARVRGVAGWGVADSGFVRRDSRFGIRDSGFG